MSSASDFTGGLFNPSGPQYGAITTRNEKQRQAMINQGLTNINAIFGGGNADFYSMANKGGQKFHANADSRTQPYYYLTGKGFQPYPGLGGGQSQGGALAPIEGGDITQYQRASVPTGGASGAIAHTEQGDYGQAIASTLTGGLFDTLGSLFGSNKQSPLDLEKSRYNRGVLLDKTSANYQGFGDDFYNQRAQDYVNYALPQEGQQYRTNLDAVTYNLANRGLLDSSQQKSQMSDLARSDTQAKQTIADSAIGQANDLRKTVSDAKQASIAQLYQTGDPNQAASTAVTQASQAMQPNVFAPLSNMFGSLATQYYTNQLLNSYSGGAGVPQQGSEYYNLTGGLPSQ